MPVPPGSTGFEARSARLEDAATADSRSKAQNVPRAAHSQAARRVRPPSTACAKRKSVRVRTTKPPSTVMSATENVRPQPEAKGAVRAEKAPAPNHLARAAFGVATQKPVTDQSSRAPAVRTAHELDAEQRVCEPRVVSRETGCCER